MVISGVQFLKQFQRLKIGLKVGFFSILWPLAFYPRRVGGEINTRRISTMVVSHLIVFFCCFFFGYFVFSTPSPSPSQTHLLTLFFSFSLFLSLFYWKKVKLLGLIPLTLRLPPHTCYSIFFSPPPLPQHPLLPILRSSFNFLLFAFCFLLFLFAFSYHYYFSRTTFKCDFSSLSPIFLLHESKYPCHKNV